MDLETLHSDPIEKTKDRSSPPISGAGSTRSDEISLLDFLILLVDRMRLILWITVICTLIAVVVSLLLPKRYTATVTLLPPQQNSSMSAALSSQIGSMGGMAALAGGSLGLKSPNDMYVAMLKSRTVEDAMVQRYGLIQEYKDHYPSDARKNFENHVSIDGSGKEGLIHISVEDRDPNRAAELANGYVDQFQKLSEHLAFTEASQRRLFFERQLEQSKNNLATAEEALKRTEQTTGLFQLDSQARALIESAASLRAEIAAREVEIQGMQTYATGENAQLVQAQRELDSMRAQMAKLGGKGDASKGGHIVPEGSVPEAGLEYVRKLRDVKYFETVFDILARQFEMAKLDEARQGTVIQVVDSAIPPDKRSYPKRGLIVLGAAGVGFVIGIFAALFQAGFLRLKENAEVEPKIDHLRNAFSFRRRRTS
jgi:tyrosine-protein kinase Etk/Wzc